MHIKKQQAFPLRNFPVHISRFKYFSNAYDRYLALILWKIGLWEQFQHDLIKRYCQPSMCVIDIGANIGFHTLQMAQSVGEQGKVYAFEPDPSNFATLKRNLDENHIKNVTTVNAAISSKTGKVKLFQSEFHHGDHRIYKHGKDDQRSINIQAYALDDYIDPNQVVDLIKIDIQGAEGLALSGMAKLIDRCPKLLIIMEFWPMGLIQTGFSAEDLLSGMVNRGFSIYEIDELRKTLHPINDIREIVNKANRRRSYCNLLLSRLHQSELFKDILYLQGKDKQN